MTSRAALRCAVAVLLALELLVSKAAADSRFRVVLLEPSSADAIGIEVLARVHGELVAAGFQVLVLPLASDLEPQIAVESEKREAHPAAVLALRQLGAPSGGSSVAELWISDRLLSETLVQRTSVNPENPTRDIAALALHVVELLKARTAELALRAEQRPENASSPPATPAVAERPREPVPTFERTETFTLSAGVGLLDSLRAVPPLWSPVARATIALPKLPASGLRLEARASLTGFGRSLDLRAAGASAKVNQVFGSIDFVARFAPESAFQPYLALGCGLYAVRVNGRSEPAHESSSERTVSPFGALSGGLRTRLGSRFHWAAEAGLLAPTSKTVVRLERTEAWENRAPLLFLSTALGAGF